MNWGQFPLQVVNCLRTVSEKLYFSFSSFPLLQLLLEKIDTNLCSWFLSFIIYFPIFYRLVYKNITLSAEKANTVKIFLFEKHLLILFLLEIKTA